MWIKLAICENMSALMLWVVWSYDTVKMMCQGENKNQYNEYKSGDSLITFRGKTLVGKLEGYLCLQTESGTDDLSVTTKGESVL